MDPVHFSTEEVLDMALRIEENGERFYKDAAEAAKEKGLKELFEFLASEERKHSSYFSKLKQISGSETEPPFNQDFEEVSLYLNAYADSKIFANPDEGAGLPESVKDSKGAVEYAIFMEKESLLFYYELLRAVRIKDQETLNEIINEERSHLRKLTEINQELFG